MKIGVISDTHDDIAACQKLVKILNREKLELVLHLGDWASPSCPDFFKDLKFPIKSIWGNNEGDIDRFWRKKEKKKWKIEFLGEVAELKLGGLNLVLYHGTSKVVTRALIKSGEYDLVLTGHTHVPVVEKQGKTIHVNPGSICKYAKKFKPESSWALIDTKTKKVEIREF
jgi:putative phosphoesterase